MQVDLEPYSKKIIYIGLLITILYVIGIIPEFEVPIIKDQKLAIIFILLFVAYTFDKYHSKPKKIYVKEEPKTEKNLFGFLEK